jgi:hypothetical protein
LASNPGIRQSRSRGNSLSGGSTHRGSLVMGSAVGLPVEVLPFLTSLRNSGYSGDVALFAGRRLTRELRAHDLPRNILFRPAPTLLLTRYAKVRASRILRAQWRVLQTLGWITQKAVGRLSPSARLRTMVAQLVCTPMEARFLYYLEFLRHHEYDRVLVTDIRDVLFQSDPFTQLPETGVAVSIELRSYTISTESHNRRWMEGSSTRSAITRHPASGSHMATGSRWSVTSS